MSELSYTIDELLAYMLGHAAINYHRSYIVQSYAILRRTYPCQFLLDLVGSMINPSSRVYCSLEHRTDSLFCNNFCFHRDLQSRSGDLQWKGQSAPIYGAEKDWHERYFRASGFFMLWPTTFNLILFRNNNSSVIQTRSQKRRWRTNRCSRVCSSPYL